MKILVIDNYDSFTFNLYHYLSSLKAKVDVIRNDKITEKEIIKTISSDTQQPRTCPNKSVRAKSKS
jgi:anthranilate/para-aminobenzoate synthase component II